MPFSLTKSPSQVSLFKSNILHYLATEIAVKTLSPVAITVLILQSFKMFRIPLDWGFSLFSNIRRPRNSKSFSTSSRLIVCDYRYLKLDGSSFYARAITL